jgi:hypothetical protein
MYYRNLRFKLTIAYVIIFAFLLAYVAPQYSWMNYVYAMGMMLCATELWLLGKERDQEEEQNVSPRENTV